MMLAFEYCGEYIEDSHALNFIVEACEEDPELKDEMYDYMFDVMTGDRGLMEDLKEWFFFGPAKYIDLEEERLGHQIDHDYELWRDENVKAI